MSEENPDTALRSKPIIERHIQTLLLAIVAGLIGWQGMTTLKLSESSARQDERIVNLTHQVSEIHRELRDQRDNYVTLNEFERRMSEQRSETSTLRDRVRTLEERR